MSLKTKDGEFLLSPVISCASYSDGKISYDANMVLPIVVHEFCHAYCNSLIDATWNEISDVAGELYKLNRKTLVRQAYSWSDDMRTFSIIFLFEEKHTYGFFIDGDGFRFIHVDFLMRYKGKCTLVEVKATTGNTKSSRTVLKNPDVYHMDSAIKLGDYNVGRSDKLLNIPFYMAFLLNEP